MDSQRQIYDPLLDSYYVRNEEFFQTGEDRISGSLHLQREFNPVRHLNVYYFKKDSNSRLHFIGNEIFQVTDIVRGLLSKIAEAMYQDHIPSLKHCKRDDPKYTQFWSKGQVVLTESENILNRPMRMVNGQYSITFF
jgi:hypothetical protein